MDEKELKHTTLCSFKFYSFAMSIELHLRTHNSDIIGASVSHAVTSARIRDIAVMGTVGDMILSASALETTHYERKSSRAVAKGTRVTILFCGCGEAQHPADDFGIVEVPEPFRTTIVINTIITKWAAVEVEMSAIMARV